MPIPKSITKKSSPFDTKNIPGGGHSRYRVKKSQYKKILIHNIPYLFTCDRIDKLKYKKNYSIAVAGDVITRVAPAKEFKAKKEFDVVYDAGKRGGTVITPGLINTHAHIHMYLMRTAMMLDEGEGIDKTIAAMAKWQQYEDDDVLTYASIGDITEQQKNGITTTLTHGPSFEAAETASVVSGHNIINAVSAVSNSRPTNNLEMAEKILSEKKNYSSVPAISLHYLFKTPIETLKKISKLVEKYDTLVTFHMSESLKVVKENIKTHGIRETALLKKSGLLNSRTLASHVIHVNNKEIELMAKNNVGVAHLPTSNAIHKSGRFPFWKFSDTGSYYNISLGTDSVVSKNRLDILTEAYQARATHLYSRTIKFGTLFKMMTINGARVLGLPKTGKILPGYKADLSFWKLKDRGFIPFDPRNPYTLLGNLITHNGRIVRDLMINGRFVIKDRKHLLVNESRLLKILQEKHVALRKKVK